MSKTIEIHEFSTGIEVTGTADDWVAGGFTGNYLNSTLESVPISVQNAIASQYFAVAESTSSDKPAVIGREIIRADEKWSVVAVVTKGTDNMGRPASLYRYFLCQGVGNIHHILQWMYQEKGGILVFDSFDKQTVGNPHRYEITSPNSINLRPKLESLLSDSPPVIIPSKEACTPLILNKMANCLESPVSWAFNVKGIAKPRIFQIIQPVDSQSEEIIKRAIAKTPKQPQLQGEEQPITTAIRGLTNRKTFRPEHMPTIENALANSQINDEAWKHLFEQLGAKDEIRDKTYAPSMIRLLTLQAMVLPKTLPAFLSWIQQTHYNISSTFQTQILQYIKQYQNIKQYQSDLLQARLIEGVILIIPHLVKDFKLFLDSTVWLLGESEGIWNYYYKNKVMPEIDKDFNSIAQCYRTKQNSVNLEVLDHPYWQSIYKDLQTYWQPDTKKSPLTKYQPIADFFGKIGKINQSSREWKLYALFSYVSQGKISQKLFSYLKEKRNPIKKDGLTVQVYGVWLEREVPWSEQLYLGTKSNTQKLYFGTSNFIKKLRGWKVRFLWLVVIIPISFTAGIYYRNLQIARNTHPGIDLDPVASQSDFNIPPDKLTQAFKNFKNTRQVIKEEIYQPLFNEFNNGSNDHNELRTEIIRAILITLDPETKLRLIYGAVIEKEDLDTENNSKEKQWVTNWIQAIYSYQQNKKKEIPSINVAGFLLPNGQTNKPLRNDIKNNIDPKFKTKTADNKSNLNSLQIKLPEAFENFKTTKKVIKEEIYQPLFDEFNNGINAPDKLRIGIIKAIGKTLDPDNKLSLQYGSVIEKEDLDIENNSKEKQWVTNWIQAIYSYQQNKKKEIPSINVAGFLLPNGLTNEPLRNDIKNNIDPKFKPTPSDAYPQPQVDGQ